MPRFWGGSIRRMQLPFTAGEAGLRKKIKSSVLDMLCFRSLEQQRRGVNWIHASRVKESGWWSYRSSCRWYLKPWDWMQSHQNVIPRIKHTRNSEDVATTELITSSSHWIILRGRLFASSFSFNSELPYFTTEEIYGWAWEEPLKAGAELMISEGFIS